MRKKSLTIYSFIATLLVVLLNLYSPFLFAKEGMVSLKILSVHSPFPLEDEELDGNLSTYFFHNAISKIHPPILVEYEGQKSLLLFVPAAKDDQNKDNLIYNFNLGNQKINEVGRIDSSDIISVFSYVFAEDDAYFLLMQKSKLGTEETLYSTARFSILKKDGGLYIQSFRPDRITIEGVTTCIDGGTDYLGNKRICKYKDAASIKKYFDSMGDRE